jgi:hypothetical protein
MDIRCCWLLATGSFSTRRAAASAVPDALQLVRCALWVVAVLAVVGLSAATGGPGFVFQVPSSDRGRGKQRKKRKTQKQKPQQPVGFIQKFMLNTPHPHPHLSGGCSRGLMFLFGMLAVIRALCFVLVCRLCRVYTALCLVS